MFYATEIVCAPGAPARTTRMSGCRALCGWALLVAAGTSFAVSSAANVTADDRREGTREHFDDTRAIATVVDDDGVPVEGAVVVTSAGGEGVTDSDGVARFPVAFDASRAVLHVTAATSADGVNSAGSVHLEPTPQHGNIDAGTITVSADGACEPAWLPTFGDPGLKGEALALATFDDGSGPALYAGGTFTTAGGAGELNHIARWDGEKWSAVGGGVVNGADLGILLSAWEPCDDPSPGTCPADLTGDGTVRGADLGVLLSNWTS